MKKNLLLTLLCILSLCAFSQAPEGFNYQAIVRNGSGGALAEQQVSYLIKILKGDYTGPVVYSEKHQVSTNMFGLVNLVIGNGTDKTGDFSSIGWGSDSYYINVWLDITGGTSYMEMGTSQLLSVPYAMHAKSVSSEADPQVGANTTGFSPRWDGTALVAGKIFQDADGKIGIGTTSPQGAMEIASTTNGLLIPRMTTAERDLISNPVAGLQIYNTTTNCFNVWSGSSWGQICPDCGFTPVPGNNGPICEGLTLELTTVAITGATYSWTGPNGFTSNQQNPVINNATVAASGAYFVTATLNGCTSQPVATVATVTPGLGASSAGYNNPVCVSKTLNLTATTIPGASYTWSGPNNFFSNIQNPVIPNIQLSNTGTYYVVATLGNCSTSASVEVSVEPIPAKPGTITGTFAILPPATGVAYSVASVPSATSYTWTYSGTGATITGQGSNSITVDYACGATGGTLSVTANNICNGASPAQTQVVMISTLGQPGSITGSASIVPPQSAQTYSISPVSGATSYVWTVPATLGTIINGQGTTSISVDYNCGAASGVISVAASNSCGAGPVRNFSVTIGALPTPGSISGPGTITFPQAGVAYSIPAVTGATTYTWTVPTGAMISSGQGSNSILVDYPCGATSGNLSVTASNTCSTSGTNSLSVTITTNLPAMPGAISGNNNVPAGVSGVTYSISPVSAATSYLWSVPSGGVISSGQGTTAIVVNYSCSAVSGNVSVMAVNDCGFSSARTLAVTVTTAPSQPGAITGITTVPQGSTGITYSVPTVTGASSYTWSFSGTGATITAGQGTNAATFDFACGATNGTISVVASNSCNNPGTARTLGIAISGTLSTPGAITGITTPLFGQTAAAYSVSAVNGASTYNWTVPSGATIASGQGTNSILVDFGCSASAGNISVTVSNSCIGAGTASNLAITPGSTIAQPGTITGTATVPQGKTGVAYSVAPVTGATTYTWSYSGTGATIAAGQGTTSVLVDFACTATSGNITVTASNSCIGPSAARTFAVTIGSLSTPGTITGPASVPQGSTGITYSVASVSGATSYTWIVPVGASVVHGQGTNSVLVDFGCTVGNGNILVTADNSCGSSGGSSLNVTISASTPAAPGGISAIPTTSIPKGLSGVIHSISPVTGATSYTWTVPAGATIVSGQGSTSIIVDYTCSAVSGNVSVVANNKCGSSTATSLYMTVNASPAQPGGITGTASVPKGSAGFVYSITAVTGATQYLWTVPSGASITSGQGGTSITVDYSCSAVSGNITVKSLNGCGTASASTALGITVSSSIAALGSITGSTSPYFGQKGVPYSVTPITGATNYTWTVPGDAVIVSGQGTSSIKVDFPCSSTNGSIVVSATNGCSSTTPVSLSFALSSATLPQPGAITGSTSVPKGTTSVNYSVAAVTGATNYTWTVPANSTITAGQGTTSIIVDFSNCNAESGNVTVTAGNDCVTSGSPQTLAVTLTTTSLPTPGAISGLQAPVQGQKSIPYSIAPVTGAVTYTWSYSGTGMTIVSGQGTTSVIAEFACGSTNGNLSVTASNGCSATSAAQTLAITINSTITISGAITGLQGPKYGQTGVTYTTTPVPGATTYTWTVPSGVTITAGQGTPLIYVDFSCSAPATGTIKVVAGSPCAGDGTASGLSFAMAGILATPGTISGLSTIAKGVSDAVYSVSPVQGATGYTWSVPVGFVIKSGQGTNSIKTDIGCSAASGVISVTANNACETTTASTLSVTVSSTLATPGVITGSSAPVEGSSVNYSIVPVPGVSNYNWTAPAGATLTSGAGTNSVWYAFGCGASAGNIAVTVNNICISAGTAATLAITPVSSTAISTLGQITETINQGVNSRTYSVAPVGNALYGWSVPEGMTIVSGQGTNSITTNFTGSVTGTVSVTATNTCQGQSSTATLNVTISNGVYFVATSSGQFGTIQTWTVPSGVSLVTIEAYGAQGGGTTGALGGLGAIMKGTFTVTPGQSIRILVGQAGSSSGYFSGGGGTFVTDAQNNPLLVAGGGGTYGNPGLITTTGGGAGAGSGGSGGTIMGGGGFYSDGAGGGCSDGGKSFVSGGSGGSPVGSGSPGGFGGGSGSGRTGGFMSSCTNYGSGGGYSGGSSYGGGGSFNSGSNQSNSPGVNAGDGKVIITW